MQRRPISEDEHAPCSQQNHRLSMRKKHRILEDNGHMIPADECDSMHSSARNPGSCRPRDVATALPAGQEWYYQWPPREAAPRRHRSCLRLVSYSTVAEKHQPRRMILGPRLSDSVRWGATPLRAARTRSTLRMQCCFIDLTFQLSSVPNHRM